MSKNITRSFWLRGSLLILSLAVVIMANAATLTDVIGYNWTTNGTNATLKKYTITSHQEDGVTVKDSLFYTGDENNIVNIPETFEYNGITYTVVAIDAKKRADGSGWNVYKHGGRIDVGLDAVEWAKKAESLGAGEILLTSMDGDGTKAGYDIALTKAISEAVSIPVIASGGAGTMEHFYEALTEGGAEAALAASLFHYKELEIREVKTYLKDRGIPMRL